MPLQKAESAPVAAVELDVVELAERPESVQSAFEDAEKIVVKFVPASFRLFRNEGGVEEEQNVMCKGFWG